MASRRQAHCHRRAVHHQIRTGTLPAQGGPAAGDAPSPKAAKASKAQKPRKA